MVREVVIVQVGQCGNQIGRRFWTEQLNEAVVGGRTDGGFYESAMSALFRNVDVRYTPAVELSIGSVLSTLRARAIMIDTEQGVVSETFRDPIIGDLFEEAQLITDTSGAGNNWAHGYMVYGRTHGDDVEEATRRVLEGCDSPQAFIFLHSICGGTGSGLGSFVLEQLQDFFPELCRLNVAVFPSGNDEDVITAPYNAVLSMQQLTQVSDSVIPLENSAMLKYCSRHTHLESLPLAKKRSTGFDEVNDVAAQFLSHLMAGTRYSGDLNVDVNEISTNLVPFPQLKYLTASFAPLSSTWPEAKIQHYRCDPTKMNKEVQRLIYNAFAPDSKLVATHENEGANEITLACALLARGDVVSTDMMVATECLKPKHFLPDWNPDGFKIGICASPPPRSPSAVLCLENSTAIMRNFEKLRGRFNKLFQARAMLHHYTSFVEEDVIRDALYGLDQLIHSYKTAQVFVGSGRDNTK